MTVASSPRSLSFTMLSCILIAILLLTSISIDYSHHDKTGSSILFVSGFSSTSTSVSKVSSYNHPLKGSQKQSQFYNNRYNYKQLWSSSTETTTTAEESSSSIPKVKTVKQKKKSTKKYTKKKYKKKGGYKKKKKSFYKSNFPDQKGQPMHFNEARQFNSQLTNCNSCGELLSTFMEQTSSSSTTAAGGDDKDTGGDEKKTGVNGTEKTSAATHLAGANKVNSVNFSTCLHRLARFANNNNNNYQNQNNGRQNNQNHNKGRHNQNQNQQSDERTKVLSDPRFALLVCSMAEMACGVNANVSMKDGSLIVQDWQRIRDDFEGVAGEEVAKASNQAMAKLSNDNIKTTFSSRECSNVCWALAKLQLAPPCTAFYIGRVVNDFSPQGYDYTSINEMSLDVLSSSLDVRMKLLEEARNRSNKDGTRGSWIPELSRLSAKVLDLIAVQIINEYGLRNNDHREKSGGTFNPQEMASVLWAFAKAKRGDDALFSTVARELMRQTEFELEKEGGGQRGPKPQELSNTIWAFATAGLRGDTQVDLVKFIADALDEGSGSFFGFQFKPQEFSNTAWALATLHSKRGANTSPEAAVEDDGIVRILRWVSKFIIQNVDSFKPQELSNSIWAFSTLGFGYDESCGTNNHNEYTHVASSDPSGDKELVYETLEVIAESALQRLDRFKAQELNNLVWAFARLGHKSERSEKLFSGVAEQLVRRTWHFKPQDIGTTLWSFATAEFYDQDAFRAGAARLNFRQIRFFKPQEMSNTVWALATAGFAPEHIRAFDTTLVPASQRPTKEMITNDPITECFAAVASEAMRRSYEFKDQELKDVLWSFSKIGVRHPELFKNMAKHIVGKNGRGFSNFSSQGLGNTLWSYAKQAQLSLEVIDSLGDSVKLVSTGRLAVYETSCLDNGEAVVKRLFVRAAEAGIELGLSRFTNQDLSNTLWAYATTGMLHSGFFKHVEKEIISRLKQKRYRFRGQEIANILWSYATLNAQPDISMVDALSSHVASICQGKNGVADEHSIARLFSQRQELANLAWSCAVIGRYPKELMNILYIGLLGTNVDPEQIKKVFNDDGLQQSSIMTMYYVQVAATIEASDLGLSLPRGFPNGWGEDRGHKHTTGDDLVQTSSSMLTLTVSKLQQGVSNTFNSIGFDHVLEHVIDSNNIQDEYGIQLPQAQKEFLSIDIANVEERIGIEVDGPGHFVRLIDKPGKSSTTKQQFDDLGENRFNGPTILKHRLLGHLGWDIIHLPYWEYQEVQGDTAKEMEYCQSLL